MDTREDLGIGLVGGYTIGKYFDYRHYERIVGVENASFRGYHIWNTEHKALRRAQPRRSVSLGISCIVLTFVFTVLAGHVGGLGFLYLLAAVTVYLAVRSLRHRAPPAAAAAAINAEHQAGRFTP